MVVFYGNREGAVGVGVMREDGGGDCKYALAGLFSKIRFFDLIFSEQILTFLIHKLFTIDCLRLSYTTFSVKRKCN